MAMSTIMMPCNVSGWFDAKLAARYGIADFDWSNVRSMWARDHPMDDGARLSQQVQKVKTINPKTHVWVYRNLVKALSWYAEVGEKLADPAYAGWFLPFRKGGAVDLGNNTWHSQPCTDGICSPLYHSQDQTPRDSECGGKCDCGGVPCGEYIWDHRNESLREWLVKEHVMGALGMGNPNISGFYFDDEWSRSGHGWSSIKPPRFFNGGRFNLSDCKNSGPSEIEEHCLLDMGLSEQDAKDLTLAWRNTTVAALQAVHAAGGWVWQMFTESNVGEFATNESAACAKAYRAACTSTSPHQTHIVIHGLSLSNHHSPGSITDAEGDVAKFLVLRGPHAYLGTGWVGCVGEGAARHSNETYVRPPWFDYDYGTPTGLCKESTPGVFTREWTKATAQHDCNTGQSSIAMRHQAVDAVHAMSRDMLVAV